MIINPTISTWQIGNVEAESDNKFNNIKLIEKEYEGEKVTLHFKGNGCIFQLSLLDKKQAYQIPRGTICNLELG